jgi:tRNA(fMet)-specific endonuclease VapC
VEYLLDTNICIYLIKKKPENILKRFRELPLGSVGISSITAVELQFGVNKSQHVEQNRQALNQLLIPLEIFDFDYSAAIEYGRIRNDLEKSGIPIGPLDTLIAAHALSLNVILVSNNIKEFKRVKNLKLENWI